jgi:hypothetical protein
VLLSKVEKFITKWSLEPKKTQKHWARVSHNKIDPNGKLIVLKKISKRYGEDNLDRTQNSFFSTLIFFSYLSCVVTGLRYFLRMVQKNNS